MFKGLSEVCGEEREEWGMGNVGMTKCNVTLMWYGLATVFADNCRTLSEHVE